MVSASLGSSSLLPGMAGLFVLYIIYQQSIVFTSYCEYEEHLALNMFLRMTKQSAFRKRTR